MLASLVFITVSFTGVHLHDIKQFSTKQIETLIETAVAVEGLPWGFEEVAAMRKLCWKESRFMSKEEHRRSTAYGLYQFLDSTWRGTGIKKTSCPLMQTIAAVRYIKNRYKTPKKALAFFNAPKIINGKKVHYY